MTSILTEHEHAKLATTLAGWGVAADQIAETLADGVFGPGVTGMQPEQPELGLAVGILTDEHRDTELAMLFARRRTLDDETFLNDWVPAPTRIWVMLCPHAPEALLAYSIGLERPWSLRRTFLLLASKQAHVLALLQQPGTTVWLVPHTIGIREWTKEGAGTAYDIWGQSLPLGPMPAPSTNIRLALEHVGHDG